VVAMRSTRSNEQPRGNEGRLDGVELVEGRGRWARTRSEKNVAALGTCERGRGLRELRKTGNDKNMAYHHNHVSACKREKKLQL